MSSHLDLSTLFPLAAGLFTSESEAIIAVFWWLPAPSWRAVCLLIIKVVLFCFPPGSVPSFFLLLTWHCQEELCGLSGLSEKSSPSSCDSLAWEECSRVPGGECRASRVASSSYSLSYVLSVIVEKEKPSRCACVRAVAAAKEWGFAEEMLGLAFLIRVHPEMVCASSPSTWRLPWRLPGILKPTWL